MDVSVTGKHVDVGEALRDHVIDQLDAGVRKYFDRALDASATFSREGHAFRADISVHSGRGMVVQGGASSDDAYGAFDGALSRIAKQLRRYKRRLKDHHKNRGDVELIAAPTFIIAPDEEDEAPVDAQPTIIAELSTEIATLTVGEAVMRMDLADYPIVMFRNSAHGGHNVVYRRPDGNIGWIDPQGTE
jgi:ribosomal subunit interface protein